MAGYGKSACLLLVVGVVSAQQPGWALDSCSIRSPAACGNSNNLYWSHGFAEAVTAIVASGRAEKNHYFIPAARMVEDIGQISQGMQAKRGYRIFYGSHQGNGHFRGAVAISEAGGIIGMAAIEPCDAVLPSKALTEGMCANIYVAQDRAGFDAGQALLEWSMQRVASERDVYFTMGWYDYIQNLTVDFYQIHAGHQT